MAALTLTMSASPAGAGPAADRSGSQDDATALASRRCNDISGSPLCIDWYRDANYNGSVSVSYRKDSGPTRYVRLYVASCGQPMVQVFAGNVSAGGYVWGSWHGRILPGACWVGYMRIGNTQWTTGQLYS